MPVVGLFVSKKLPSMGEELRELGEVDGCSESAKGQIQMAPDFDEPLEDFREYME